MGTITFHISPSEDAAPLSNIPGVLMPLKLKYRVRPYSNGGKTKGRTGNSHGPTPKYAKGISIRSRRRAYGPW